MGRFCSVFIVVSWFFAMKGAYLTGGDLGRIVGPFVSQQQCEEFRLHLTRDLDTRRVLGMSDQQKREAFSTPCWQSPLETSR